MMVATAGGEERGLRNKALPELKAEDAAAKIQRTREIGNLQVYVADVDSRIDGRIVRNV